MLQSSFFRKNLDFFVFGSTWISFVIQLMVLIISFHGIYIANNLGKSKDISIRFQEEFLVYFDLLMLETFFQFVEFAFYFFFVVKLKSIGLQNMSVIRYYDWIITTPSMLISFIYYFSFLNGNRQRLIHFVQDNYQNIMLLLFWNSIMLFSGYIHERLKFVSRVGILQFLGFVSLIMTFNIIKKYVGTDKYSNTLYWTVFLIWSLYGVAFSFTDSVKNICYNFLDLFSKNFFSFFVYYQIIITRKKALASSSKRKIVESIN